VKCRDGHVPGRLTTNGLSLDIALVIFQEETETLAQRPHGALALGHSFTAMTPTGIAPPSLRIRTVVAVLRRTLILSLGQGQQTAADRVSMRRTIRARLVPDRRLP